MTPPNGDTAPDGSALGRAAQVDEKSREEISPKGEDLVETRCPDCDTGYGQTHLLNCPRNVFWGDDVKTLNDQAEEITRLRSLRVGREELAALICAWENVISGEDFTDPALIEREWKAAQPNRRYVANVTELADAILALMVREGGGEDSIRMAVEQAEVWFYGTKTFPSDLLDRIVSEVAALVQDQWSSGADSAATSNRPADPDSSAPSGPQASEASGKDDEETVARILCRRDGEEPDDLIARAGGPLQWAWKEYLGKARVVLAASGAAGPPDRNHADAAPGMSPDLPVPTPAISVPSGPQEAGASGWEPIETAPKDGTWLLLALPGEPSEYGCTQAVAYWKKDVNGDRVDGWTDLTVQSWGYEYYAILQPTHWRPLPAPPLPAIPPDTTIGGEGSSGDEIALRGTTASQRPASETSGKKGSAA